MTNETEYGPEIVVDGVRLPWLDLEDFVHHKFRGRWSGPSRVGYLNFAEITAIRLPTQHGYYQVAAHNAKHGTQFKYWPGGDEAPGDYAGGAVMDRFGGMCSTDSPELLPWRSIIGYTPKPCADANYGQIPQLDGAPTNAKMATVADFVPCERTVRLCLDKLPAALPWETAHQHADQVEEVLASLLPKVDHVEALVSEFWASKPDWETPLRRETTEWFARHLIAQGEIRG